MSFDFSAARFVAAGPTDLERDGSPTRRRDAEPLAEARIRTEQPLLTAPVIGAILLALYALFTLEATNRSLARRKKRSIGSIIGAGILGVLLAASFAVLVWGLLGRVPLAPGVGRRSRARRARRRRHRDRRSATGPAASGGAGAGSCRCSRATSARAPV